MLYAIIFVSYCFINRQEIIMIIYEVNLKVSSEIYAAYMKWLKPHIKEMLDFEGFNKAVFLKESNYDDPKFEHITVQYYVDHMDDLNYYLEHHSQKMREEGIRKFPEGFSATRRFFEISDEISPNKSNTLFSKI